MHLTHWTIEEKLHQAAHLQTQEEQICYILSSFDSTFTTDRISFFRFSPIGYVGEGVAQLEDGNLQSLSYIRDDIRSLPIIKKAVAERKAYCYSGQDMITLISSRYNFNSPVKAIIVVPIFVNNLTIAYIVSEHLKHFPQMDEKRLELLTLFGSIAGRVLIQPEKVSHPKLSPREDEILRALANGLSTKELIDLLFLSEGTIKQHIKSSFVKLGAKNRAHAVSIYLAPRI